MKNYDNIVMSCDEQLFKVLSPDSPKNGQVSAARRIENKITMENMYAYRSTGKEGKSDCKDLVYNRKLNVFLIGTACYFKTENEINNGGSKNTAGTTSDSQTCRSQ